MRRRAALVAALVLGAVLGPAVPAASAPTQAETTTVRTLPPVSGFAFSYHGQRFVTGPDGRVTVPRALSETNRRVTALTRTVALGGGREARFEKWYGTSKLGSSTGAATAAFSVWHDVRFRFTDLDGKEVQRAELGAVRVRSSTGYELDLPRADTSRPLQATRVVPDQEGLSVKDLYYTVQSVDVEGNNVVNRSQTKLFPRTDRVVTVPLLFFDARVRARDALFGFGVSGTLVLEYPNGTSRTMELGSAGKALPGLPRGQYRLAVEGPGLRIVQPVTMSRPQQVDLKVFTWLDLAAVGLVSLTTAVGLLLLGRRNHRRRRSRALPPRPRLLRRPAQARPPSDRFATLPPPPLPLVLSGVRYHHGGDPRTRQQAEDP